MKSGLMKRILTMGLCVAMLTGDCLSVAAAGNGLGTYAVTVTQNETDKKITFKHYLTTYKAGVTPNWKTQIYAPSEVVITAEDFEKNEIIKLPVQGGNNYTVTNVVVNGVNVGSVSTVELSSLSEETVIELYYSENDKAFSNPTTFFDYYVDDTRTEIVEKTVDIAWGAKITVEGKKYTVEGGTLVEGDKASWEQGAVKRTLNEGEVLKNVQIIGGTFYDELLFKGGKYVIYGPEEKFYSFDAGMNAYGTKGTPFLSMGQSVEATPTTEKTEGKVYGGNSYNDKNSSGIMLNRIYGSGGTIVEGIIVGLSGSNYEKLVMGTWNGKQIQEPGYFDNSLKDNNSKAIYENYSLVFAQTGNKYVLDYAYNQDNGNKTYSRQNNAVSGKFFPLNDVTPIGGRSSFQPSTWEDGAHNDYFGMRYDFTFSIGDYIGPLNYKFYGDDDMWVFVDGKPLLDIGGIHSAKNGEADLWSKVFNLDTTKENWWESLTEAQKKEIHQVSVLYMERGGYESTCAMEFVIPNVEGAPPVITTTPRADLELIKKDAESKEAIANVGFTLYTDSACTVVLGHEMFTGEDGKVTFSGLKEGTYYLKETFYNASAYEENSTIYTVVVTVIGNDKAVAVLKENNKNVDKDGNAYVIYNTPKKGMQVWIRKQDSNASDLALGGAVFTFESEDKTTYPKVTVTTGDDGHIKFNEVPIGTYYLTEVKAPNGYVCPSEPWIIEVSACQGHGCGPEFCHEQGNGGKGLHFQIISGPSNYLGNALWQEGPGKGQKWTEIYNDLTTDFQFKKVDAETGEALEDVEFKLYAVGAGENGKDLLVNTVKSDANGTVIFEEIIKGSYRLEETKANGYEAAGPWYLEVTVNAENTGLQMSLKNDKGEEVKAEDGMYVIENTPEKGSLTITKTVDKVNLAFGAPSFTFKIEGPDGLVLYRSITFENTSELTKSITIHNLPLGTYKVTELETLRYKLVTPNGVKGTVTANGEAKVAFTNNLTDTKRYSHSDIVINSFRMDENGDIQISQTREVTEDKVVEE